MVTVHKAGCNKQAGWSRAARFFQSFPSVTRLGPIDPVHQHHTIPRVNRALELYNMAAPPGGPLGDLVEESRFLQQLRILSLPLPIPHVPLICVRLPVLPRSIPNLITFQTPVRHQSNTIAQSQFPTPSPAMAPFAMTQRGPDQ